MRAVNELLRFGVASPNQMAPRTVQGPSRAQGGQASSSNSMAVSSAAQPHSHSTTAHFIANSPSHSPSRDSRFARNTILPTAGRQQAGPSHDPIGSLAIPGTNNTYSNATAAAPASAHAYSSSAHFPWVPQDSTYHHSGPAALGFDSTSSTYPADVTSWMETEQPGLDFDQSQHQSLPPRNPSAPAIRVTTDFAGAQDLPQPQDAPFSASSAASSLPPPDYNTYNYYSGHLSPHRSHFMPQDPETMQTPVSPVSAQNSPHDTSMPEQVSRKRSHSEMSHQDVAAIANAAHSRSGSIVSATGASPNEASDDFYPKRLNSRAFKRGDPPMNEEHKFICDFSEECRGQTFDRKCEWR